MTTGLTASVTATLGSFSIDIDLAVAPGETLALLGPNGSGKTTCIDLIAGLRTPDSGRLVLDGTAFFDDRAGVNLPPEERRVGVVFQDYALFPHESVRGNIAYGPRARRRGRPERDRIVSEWMARLDLADLADRPVAELSGGQRQRVALARALASDARLLLLDEPFASLDATRRASVRTELRGYLRDVGLPALLVTHDPLDAFVVGERLAILENGRVVQSGTSEDLLAHPRTPFVADLVGLNVYGANVAPGTGLKEARIRHITFHVLADGLSGVAHLAFAPSSVGLSREPPIGSFQNAFMAQVRESLSLPDRLRVLLDVGVPMAADITREAGRRLDLTPGAVVWAMIKATSIRVYP